MADLNIERFTDLILLLGQFDSEQIESFKTGGESGGRTAGYELLINNVGKNLDAIAKQHARAAALGRSEKAKTQENKKYLFERDKQEFLSRTFNLMNSLKQSRGDDATKILSQTISTITESILENDIDVTPLKDDIYFDSIFDYIGTNEDVLAALRNPDINLQYLFSSSGGTGYQNPLIDPRKLVQPESNVLKTLDRLSNIQKIVQGYSIERSVVPTAEQVFGDQTVQYIQGYFSQLAKDTTITIFGDYDVDGLTSSAITEGTLKKLGFSNTQVIIPERSQGYGLNQQHVQDIIKRHKNGGLLITVDTGTNSEDLLRQIYDKTGTQTFIMDHHLLDKNVSRSENTDHLIGILNPELVETGKPNTKLSAGGVALKFSEMVLDPHNFPEHEVQLSINRQLAAISTVADLVPPTSANIAIARQGSNELGSYFQQDETRAIIPSIKMLMEKLGLQNNGIITAKDIGFGIGPVLNTLGRIDKARQAYKMLTTTNAEELKTIIEDALLQNEFRKTQQISEQITLDDIYDRAAAQTGNPLSNRKFIVAAKPKSMHSLSGLSGLQASYFTEKYGVPSVVFNEENGKWVGSARSLGKIAEDGSNNLVHIFDQIQELIDQHKKIPPTEEEPNFSSLEISYGGHELAAGIQTNNPKLFAQAVNQVMENAPKPQVERLSLGTDVSIGSWTVKKLRNLHQYAGPFWGDDTLEFTDSTAEIQGDISVWKNSQGLSLKVKGKTADDKYRTVSAYIYTQDDPYKLKEELETLKGKNIELRYIPTLQDFNGQQFIRTEISGITYGDDRELDFSFSRNYGNQRLYSNLTLKQKIRPVLAKNSLSWKSSNTDNILSGMIEAIRSQNLTLQNNQTLTDDEINKVLSFAEDEAQAKIDEYIQGFQDQTSFVPINLTSERLKAIRLHEAEIRQGIADDTSSELDASDIEQKINDIIGAQEEDISTIEAFSSEEFQKYVQENWQPGEKEAYQTILNIKNTFFSQRFSELSSDLEEAGLSAILPKVNKNDQVTINGSTFNLQYQAEKAYNALLSHVRDYPYYNIKQRVTALESELGRMDFSNNEELAKVQERALNKIKHQPAQISRYRTLAKALTHVYIEQDQELSHKIDDIIKFKSTYLDEGKIAPTREDIINQVSYHMVELTGEQRKSYLQERIEALIRKNAKKESLLKVKEGLGEDLVAEIDKTDPNFSYNYVPDNLTREVTDEEGNVTQQTVEIGSKEHIDWIKEQVGDNAELLKRDSRKLQHYRSILGQHLPEEFRENMSIGRKLSILRSEISDEIKTKLGDIASTIDKLDTHFDYTYVPSYLAESEEKEIFAGNDEHLQWIKEQAKNLPEDIKRLDRYKEILGADHAAIANVANMPVARQLSELRDSVTEKIKTDLLDSDTVQNLASIDEHFNYLYVPKEIEELEKYKDNRIAALGTTEHLNWIKQYASDTGAGKIISEKVEQYTDFLKQQGESLDDILENSPNAVKLGKLKPKVVTKIQELLADKYTDQDIQQGIANIDPNFDYLYVPKKLETTVGSDKHLEWISQQPEELREVKKTLDSYKSLDILSEDISNGIIDDSMPMLRQLGILKNTAIANIKETLDENTLNAIEGVDEHFDYLYVPKSLEEEVTDEKGNLLLDENGQPQRTRVPIGSEAHLDWMRQQVEQNQPGIALFGMDEVHKKYSPLELDKAIVEKYKEVIPSINSENLDNISIGRQLNYLRQKAITDNIDTNTLVSGGDASRYIALDIDIARYKTLSLDQVDERVAARRELVEHFLSNPDQTGVKAFSTKDFEIIGDSLRGGTRTWYETLRSFELQARIYKDLKPVEDSETDFGGKRVAHLLGLDDKRKINRAEWQERMFRTKEEYEQMSATQRSHYHASRAYWGYEEYDTVDEQQQPVKRTKLANIYTEHDEQGKFQAYRIQSPEDTAELQKLYEDRIAAIQDILPNFQAPPTKGKHISESLRILNKLVKQYNEEAVASRKHELLHMSNANFNKAMNGPIDEKTYPDEAERIHAKHQRAFDKIVLGGYTESYLVEKTDPATGITESLWRNQYILPDIERLRIDERNEEGEITGTKNWLFRRNNAEDESLVRKQINSLQLDIKQLSFKDRSKTGLEEIVEYYGDEDIADALKQSEDIFDQYRTLFAMRKQATKDRARYDERVAKQLARRQNIIDQHNKALEYKEKLKTMDFDEFNRRMSGRLTADGQSYKQLLRQMYAEGIFEEGRQKPLLEKGEIDKLTPEQQKLYETYRQSRDLYRSSRVAWRYSGDIKDFYKTLKGKIGNEFLEGIISYGGKLYREGTDEDKLRPLTEELYKNIATSISSYKDILPNRYHISWNNLESQIEAAKKVVEKNGQQFDILSFHKNIASLGPDIERWLGKNVETIRVEGEKMWNASNEEFNNWYSHSDPQTRARNRSIWRHYYSSTLEEGATGAPYYGLSRYRNNFYRLQNEADMKLRAGYEAQDRQRQGLQQRTQKKRLKMSNVDDEITNRRAIISQGVDQVEDVVRDIGNTIAGHAQRAGKKANTILDNFLDSVYGPDKTPPKFGKARPSRLGPMMNNVMKPMLGFIGTMGAVTLFDAAFSKTSDDYDRFQQERAMRAQRQLYNMTNAPSPLQWY